MMVARPSGGGERGDALPGCRSDLPDKAARHCRARHCSGTTPGSDPMHSALVGVGIEGGASLAVRDRDRQQRALHAGEQQRGRFEDLHQAQARLELFAAIAQEPRPVLRPGNQLAQQRQHLAAVAHAQREGVAAREELRERGARCLVEQDRLRPAAARTEHVAVGKTRRRRSGRGTAPVSRPRLSRSLMCTSCGSKPARSSTAAISTWLLTPCSRSTATAGRAPEAIYGRSHVQLRIETQLPAQPRCRAVHRPRPALRPRNPDRRATGTCARRSRTTRGTALPRVRRAARCQPRSATAAPRKRPADHAAAFVQAMRSQHSATPRGGALFPPAAPRRILR